MFNWWVKIIRAKQLRLVISAQSNKRLISTAAETQTNYRLIELITFKNKWLGKKNEIIVSFAP